MNFYELNQLLEMFAHPQKFDGLTEKGTLIFAMSVYRALHNQATAQDWENFDKCVEKFGETKVLDWFCEILKANHMPLDEIQQNREWFQKELMPTYRRN